MKAQIFISLVYFVNSRVLELVWGTLLGANVWADMG